IPITSKDNVSGIPSQFLSISRTPKLDQMLGFRNIESRQTHLNMRHEQIRIAESDASTLAELTQSTGARRSVPCSLNSPASEELGYSLLVRNLFPRRLEERLLVLINNRLIVLPGIPALTHHCPHHMFRNREVLDMWHILLVVHTEG